MMRYTLLTALSVALVACASIPESFSQLKWEDKRGNRGGQVMQRDMVWCLDAIETRRSLQESCMNERGWVQLK
jgi:hypothetical protein